jgi:hypothetical protein
MARLVLLVLAVGVGSYAAGAVSGPSLSDGLDHAKSSLSPFLLVSVGILIASLGYAVGNLRGLFDRRREP